MKRIMVILICIFLMFSTFASIFVSSEPLGSYSEYSSGSDGSLVYAGTIYNMVWSNNEGTVHNTENYLDVGQQKLGTIYNIKRAFLFFDTSSIPSNAIISSATIKLYGKEDHSSTDFNIVIQKGSSGHPVDPLQTDDYDKDWYSGEGNDQFHTSSFLTTGYNTITLNSNGINWIEKGSGAKTKFCIRSSRDKTPTSPTGDEYVYFYSANNADSFKPKLTVEYNCPPNTPTKPSGPTSGYIETSYTYQTMAIDPDLDQVWYWFDWGDGANSGWIGPYMSGATGSSSHSWSSTGTYSVKSKAKDVPNGAESGWSDALEVTISVPNSAPNTPSIPSGPQSGVTGESYEYSTSATDVDGDQVYYWFDWDDGTNSGWVGPYNSGQEGSATHAWNTPGTYNIKAKAKDTNNAESGWSDELTIVLTQGSNEAPNIPSKPNGPTSGSAGASYSYKTSTTDPEGNQVYYWFDWDDGTNSGWVGPYNSGQEGSATHAWNTPGTYQIQAKAKDTNNAESGWSERLTVTMKLVNDPPEKPNKPKGPERIIAETNYQYTGHSSSDPDNDKISLRFDWDAEGSHKYSDWINIIYNWDVTMDNIWVFEDDDDDFIMPICIKVQVKDEHGLKSEWSDGLYIKIQPHGPHLIDGKLYVYVVYAWGGDLGITDTDKMDQLKTSTEKGCEYICKEIGIPLDSIEVIDKRDELVWNTQNDLDKYSSSRTILRHLADEFDYLLIDSNGNRIDNRIVFGWTAKGGDHTGMAQRTGHFATARNSFTFLIDKDELAMHELGHCFGAPDHGYIFWPWSDVYKCRMNYVFLLFGLTNKLCNSCIKTIKTQITAPN